MGSMMAHLVYHVIIFRYWKNCRVEDGFHILCPDPEEELELINESYRETHYWFGSEMQSKNKYVKWKVTGSLHVTMRTGRSKQLNASSVCTELEAGSPDCLGP